MWLFEWMQGYTGLLNVIEFIGKFIPKFLISGQVSVDWDE